MRLSGLVSFRWAPYRNECEGIRRVRKRRATSEGEGEEGWRQESLLFRRFSAALLQIARRRIALCHRSLPVYRDARIQWSTGRNPGVQGVSYVRRIRR